MSMTPDMTFYGSRYQVQGDRLDRLRRTAIRPDQGQEDGRPRRAAAAAWAPSMGHGSADGRFMLYNGGYGDDHSTVDCYDIDGGRLLWTYPSNFTGVHGSHRACGPMVGMIRGAYDIAGAAPSCRRPSATSGSFPRTRASGTP